MADKRRRITPLRGSPPGKVIITDSRDHTGRHGTIPDDWDKVETVCECGTAFGDHTNEEMKSINERKGCPRLRIKAT